MFVLNKRKLFLLNRSLHRDLGYLSIGLTIVFAISGITLNHHNDWNSNYSIARKEIKLPESVHKERVSDEQLLTLAKQKFAITQKLKGKFWVSPNELKMFFPSETTIIFYKDKNSFLFEKITPRFLLRSFNGLHVNELKSYWIVVSDIYAIILFYLAISALFMVKGKYGIRGRGGILALIGLSIPIFFILNFF